MDGRVRLMKRADRLPAMAADETTGMYAIRAVERVCAILDLIQRQPTGLAVAEVAEVAELPRSSAFRYLATLEAQSYVERDPADGTYRIGPAFLPSRPHRLELLVERARPVMEELRDRYRETINLAVLDDNRAVYLEIVESPRTMRLAARPGDRDPLHCTAVGKVIAAMISEGELIAILEREGMPARTHRTITDLPSLLKETAAVTRRGYALDDRENEVDGRCVAVPIEGMGVPAALSLSAPSARFPMSDVSAVAASLAEAVQYVVPEPGDSR